MTNNNNDHSNQNNNERDARRDDEQQNSSMNKGSMGSQHGNTNSDRERGSSEDSQGDM